MSESTASLRRKIAGAGELHSVVRTMKAVAASSIGQYEKSVKGLNDYYHAIERGLGVCLRAESGGRLFPEPEDPVAHGPIGVIVFGSDQGLVGQFNEVVADFVISSIANLPGRPEVWVVGERVYTRLQDAGLTMSGLFSVPNTVKAITPLVGQIQLELEKHRGGFDYASVYVIHNKPKSGALYEPVSQRLLPLDAQWQRDLMAIPWPTKNLPEVLGRDTVTLLALIREYLFISLFRACAESLASENASRLAAMQRAERNIDELMEDLQGKFHRLRQRGIDEELFDVISGFEAFSSER